MIRITAAILCFSISAAAFSQEAAQAQDNPAQKSSETDRPNEARVDGVAKANQATHVVSVPPMPATEIASVFLPKQSSPPDLPGSLSDSDSNGNTTLGQTESPGSIELQMKAWIEELGSNEFAAREQATAQLRRVGQPAVPVLRKTAQQHPDIEVRMRAKDVAEGIVQGEQVGRIDAFLAGDEVSMEGWNIATQILGDGVRVRELYVDLVMRHENVARSLNGSSLDRQDALRAAIGQIQRGMFVEQRIPTEADAIAMLLLLNDRSMPTSRLYEGALFSILQKQASKILFSDAQLAQPFRELLAGWMTRDDVSNRQEMMWYAMTWDVTGIMPLIKTSLDENNDPVTLSIACQAVARFGDVDDVKFVRPLLKDERPASEQQYLAQPLREATVVQAQVRDAAATSIILLNRRKLSAFGMNDKAFHPKFGFIVPDVGFPIEDPQPRIDVFERITTELLKEQPDA